MDKVSVILLVSFFIQVLRPVDIYSSTQQNLNAIFTIWGSFPVWNTDSSDSALHQHVEKGISCCYNLSQVAYSYYLQTYNQTYLYQVMLVMNFTSISYRT